MLPNQSCLEILLILPTSFYNTMLTKHFQSRDYVFDLQVLQDVQISNLSELDSFISKLNLSEFQCVWTCYDPTSLFNFNSVFDCLLNLNEIEINENVRNTLITQVLEVMPIDFITTLSKKIPVLYCELMHVGKENARCKFINFANSVISEKLKSPNIKLVNVNSLIEPYQMKNDLSPNFYGIRLMFNDLLFYMRQFLASHTVVPPEQCLPTQTVFTENKNDAKEHFLLEEDNLIPPNPRTKPPFVVCKIAGHEFEIMVDTGSDPTVISLEFYEHLKAVTKVEFPTLPTPNLFIKGATGVKSKHVHSQVFIDFEFSGIEFPQVVLVVPNLNAPFILGFDFMTKYKAKIDCMEKCLVLLNESHKVRVPFKSFDAKSNVNLISHLGAIPKLFVYGDSHGRDLEPLLLSRLGNHEVVCSANPGATFDSVVAEVSKIERFLTEQDTVVIIGGTNNLKVNKSNSALQSEFNLNPLLNLKCNVVFFQIFPRHDTKAHDSQIKNLNLFLTEKLKDFSNISIIKSADCFSRRDFNDRGLHLNARGKSKLCDVIVSQVVDNFSEKSSSFYAEEREINCIGFYDLDTFGVDPQDHLENFHVETLEKNFENLGSDSNSNFDSNSSSDSDSDSDSESMQINSDGRRTRVTKREIKIMINSLNFLSSKQRGKLFKVLWKNRAVFSDQPGKCNVYGAKFKLTDHVPFADKSYPVREALRDMVRAEIQRLLKLGILERSSSPYSNSLVPVPKKDGTVRLCLDARQMNQKLITDAESPEPMDSLLYKFSKPAFVSCLDCTEGFLQIELLDEASRDLTSFKFEGRNYRFTRVPFGTKVSMQFFMKAIDAVIGTEVDHFFSRYVDDFKVVSEDFESHMEHLNLVLSKLLKAGITLKFSKCRFIQKEVDFLGHVLSKDGIKMNQERVRAIKAFVEPSSVAELLSFLGLINFYSKFADHYALLTVPLLKLTKKGTPWRWGPTEQEAFDKIKQSFIDTVILSYPDYSRRFYVNTDAALNSVAGELFQYDDDNHRRPIMFYSRVLTAAERNYTITELELLAIVACCSKFRPYILGFPTTVLTDHRALTFLKSCKLTSGRLVRWQLYLQEFDLDVQYIKASQNVAADTLSRFPPELRNLPPTDLELNVYVTQSLVERHLSEPLSRLPSLQREDSKLMTIYDKLKQGIPFKGDDFYRFYKDTLFFKSNKDKRWKLCVPGSLENILIKQAHESIGHFGAQKMYHYLRSFATFPRMEIKVRKATASCLPCQRCKAQNRGYHSSLEPIIPTQPLELLSVDLYGPLPTSRGNFTFIFVCLDVFTKFVKLYPLRRGTGVIVTRKMLEKYVPDVGKPKFVLADRGPCFRSNVWHEKLKENNIVPTHSSPYNPSSNPVERYMRCLGNFFRLYCREHHKNWIDYLEFFESCLNHTFNDSTGCTPIELMKGEEPQNFLKNLVEFPESLPGSNSQLQLKIIKERLLRKAGLRKQRHDKNSQLHTFKIGDKVLLKTHHLSNAAYGEIKKFFALYDGPYVITDIVSKNAFNIKNPDTNLPVGVYNANLLRPFVE